MNNRIASSLISFFSAALVTITMLASVNGLATNQPSAAHLARVVSSTPSV